MIEITLDGRKVKAQEGRPSSPISGTQHRPATLCQHDELSLRGLPPVHRGGEGQRQMGTRHRLQHAGRPGWRSGRIPSGRSRPEAGRLLAVLPVSRDPAVRIWRRNWDRGRGGADAECVLCGLCTRTCREIVGVAALSFEDRGLGRDVDEPRIAFDANACIGCGSCAYVCPTGHVKMEATGDKRIIWDKAFKMATCQVCGRPFAPEDQLKYISTRAGVPMSRLKTCMSCR